MQVVRDNVGSVDAVVRLVAGLVLIALGPWAMDLLDVDWAPTVVIGAWVVAGFLLLTVEMRFDPFYEMLGWSTVRERARRMAGRAPRPARR